MRDWYYIRAGQQIGPMQDAHFRQLISSGGIARTDMIWTQGWQTWQPAGSVADLFPPGTAVMPPPLPTSAPPIAYASPYPTGPKLEDEPAMRWLLPVGRSGWAIAAGYLGLLSLLLVPAPAALICGLIAVRNMRKDPRKHGMGRAIFGIVMGALGSVGLALFIVHANMGR